MPAESSSRFQNRQVVAQRLAARRAGDDDPVAPRARRLERRRLMRIQLLDPAPGEDPLQRSGQRLRRLREPPRPLRQHLDVLELPGVVPPRSSSAPAVQPHPWHDPP